MSNDSAESSAGTHRGDISETIKKLNTMNRGSKPFQLIMLVSGVSAAAAGAFVLSHGVNYITLFVAGMAFFGAILAFWFAYDDAMEKSHNV